VDYVAPLKNAPLGFLLGSMLFSSRFLSLYRRELALFLEFHTSIQVYLAAIFDLDLDLLRLLGALT
jgi:hypothetical protein